MSTQILAVALCAAVSVIVALVAGWLSWVDGASPAGAVLTGGTAFGGTLALALVVVTAVRGL